MKKCVFQRVPAWKTFKFTKKAQKLLQRVKKGELKAVILVILILTIEKLI